MCTLSWTATGSGYELFFNRDERRSRGPEEAPREDLSGDVRFLAPRDGEGGGTWISVNELGLTNSLLNGYTESRATRRVPARSRGLLVLELAELGTTELVLARLAALDLAPFEPFVLCTFQLAGPRGENGSSLSARTARWDGLELTASTLGPEDAPVCSSSLDAAGARRRRRAAWEHLAARGALTGERLAQFHRSHLDAPDAYSPCMHRADAETRSMVRVEVLTDRVHMTHTPGPPCSTPAGTRLTLDRHPTPSTRRGRRSE